MNYNKTVTLGAIDAGGNFSVSTNPSTGVAVTLSDSAMQYLPPAPAESFSVTTSANQQNSDGSYKIAPVTPPADDVMISKETDEAVSEGGSAGGGSGTGSDAGSGSDLMKKALPIAIGLGLVYFLFLRKK